MITGLPMPDAVTVLVSTELLAELEDWSAPVQIQVRRTPGIGSGYELVARTHTCDGLDLDRLVAIRWGDKVIDPTGVVYVLADHDELRTREHGGTADQPRLGLATTQELISELAARADVAATVGEAWPTYTTVSDD